MKDLTDIEKAKAILKKYGIKNERDLQKELRENPINIGIFTQPIKKKTN